MIIAVDGPAASGKGTIARALAAHYALPHLDTGLLYRAVGLAVLEAGGDPASPEDALQAAEHLSSALDDPGRMPFILAAPKPRSRHRRLPRQNSPCRAAPG